MTKIRTIRLPDEFYHRIPTAGGGRRVDYDWPNVDPYGKATAYVTDGAQYGLQFADGRIDWLGNTPEHAFGDGAEIVEN